MSKSAPKAEETEYQKQLASTAAQEWNRNQDVFVPVENEYKREAAQMGSDQTYNKVAGDIHLGAKTANSNMSNQVQKGLNQSGINPNSGKAATIQNQIIDTGMGNENQTQGQGQFSATQRYVGNTQNVVGIGQGQKATATAGLQDIAQASGQKAINDARTEANKVSIPAAIAGTGASLIAGSDKAQEYLGNVGKNIKSGLSDFGGTNLGAKNIDPNTMTA